MTIKYQNEIHSDYNVTSINIDNNIQMVSVTVEKGLDVKNIRLTMQYAQYIGLINLDALKQYL